MKQSTPRATPHSNRPAIHCALFLAATALFAIVAVAAMASHPAATVRIAARTDSVTYAKDIAPILYEQCASCHRPGEVAPFSLLSYGDAKKRAAQIAAVTQKRYMPPWKADSHGEFQNERRLTTRQIALIQRWSDSGAPEGNPADLPLPPHFTAGWGIGKPDAEFTAPSYSIPADGPDIYRCFVLPTDYTEDRYVTAIEVRPGNRAVEHHAIAYLDTSHKARLLDTADPGPGYTSYGGIGVPTAGGLGGWAPGNTPHPLPAGVGILLPKGADIVLQIHYHPTGKPETDQTRLGLYFCNGPVDKRVRARMVIAPRLHIPAGDANYETEGSQAVPTDVTVLDVMPHMHLLGRDMKVTASLPNGATRLLVSVPDWDFNWQTTYAFKQPIKLPKGSMVHLVAHYDNSEQNPRNPNSPPQLVTWGEKTTDEMCIAFVFYTVDSEHLTKGISADDTPDLGTATRAEKLRALVRMFDKNGDGHLDPDEQAAMMQFIKDWREKRHPAAAPAAQESVKPRM